MSRGDPIGVIPGGGGEGGGLWGIGPILNHHRKHKVPDTTIMYYYISLLLVFDSSKREHVIMKMTHTSSVSEPNKSRSKGIAATTSIKNQPCEKCVIQEFLTKYRNIST